MISWFEAMRDHPLPDGIAQCRTDGDITVIIQKFIGLNVVHVSRTVLPIMKVLNLAVLSFQGGFGFVAYYIRGSCHRD
jgi:hypothetical protein